MLKEELVISGIKTTGEVIGTVNSLQDFIDRQKASGIARKGKKEIYQDMVNCEVEKQKQYRMEEAAENAYFTLERYANNTRNFSKGGDAFTEGFREELGMDLRSRLAKRCNDFCDKI